MPNMPNTQQVLEDLLNDELEEFSTDFDVFHDDYSELRNTYECYRNFKQLQKNVIEQDGLNSKIIQLNEKLAENVANMKKQK